MSNSATRSRVATCSAPTAGDQFIAAQPSRRSQSAPGQQRAVRLEPLRTFPSGAGEALRAERRVPLVERRQPELPRRGHLLERVQDVVDLAVLLRAASPHVRRRRLERVEPVRVGLGQVVAGLAVHHPLGDLLSHPAAVRDPHRLADPESADVRRLADDRAGVRREREHPVDRPSGIARVAGDRRAPGSSRSVSRSAATKSAGVNGISDGIVPSPCRRMSRCGVTIGSWR